MLHIDFETRSTVDLRKTGAEIYANDDSTDVVCMGYAFGDEPVELWTPADPAPMDVLLHISRGDKFVAHNAVFELLIWAGVGKKKYGWPEIKIQQATCTMVMAYAMALPGNLENAAKAVGMKQEKDMKGNRVMLQLSKPRKVEPDGTVIWWTDPQKFARVYDYCKQDVSVERELYKRLLPLSTTETKYWHMDFAINQRGVKLDVAAAEKALIIIESEKERLNNKIREISDNGIATTTANGQFKDWLNFKGVHCTGVAKADVTFMLNKKTLPPECREALLLRQEAAKSSTAKVPKMLESASPIDGRIRGIFQFTAATTGRWAGRRIQPQNFPRPSISQEMINAILDDFNPLTIDICGATLPTISNCLRGLLVAGEGCDLLAADYSAIEARVLAWLAGEEYLIKLFMEGGRVYEYQASKIYRTPIDSITSDQRFVGKVAQLALGYQGGERAFKMMALAYGIDVSDAEAKNIKNAWRDANPNIVRYWHLVENAALSAVLHPGVFGVGAKGRQVKFKKNGSFLWCQLPSGRVLCYPYPQIQSKLTPWGAMKDVVTHMGVNSVTRKWERRPIYGGLEVENITQAVARDVLASALWKLEECEYKVVMHVHDEGVCEVPKDGPQNLKEMCKIMEELPPWAKGLPIKAEGWRGKRYRK